MTILFSLIFIIALAGLIILSTTRPAKLSGLARTLHVSFDKIRDTVITDDTIQHLEFFNRYFHQYKNVFTFSNPSAFLRISDDKIFSDADFKKPLSEISIFTAEFKKHQFPILKIIPVKSFLNQTKYPLITTNINEIDTQYHIHLTQKEATAFLSPAFLSFLKSHPSVYLELNENSLIYHEHSLIPVEDIQLFRMRGTQILQEFEHILTETQKQTNPAELVKEESDTVKTSADQAEAMLTALMSGNQTLPEQKKNGLGIGLFVLLLIVLGISLFAWILIKNIPK